MASSSSRTDKTMIFYTDGPIEQRGQDLYESVRARREFVESLEVLSPRRRATKS